MASKHGLRRIFTDSAKRSTVFLVAVSANTLFVFLNLFGVFDGAPAIVWIAIVAVEILFILPVLIAVVVFSLKDQKARRRGEPKP